MKKRRRKNKHIKKFAELVWWFYICVDEARLEFPVLNIGFCVRALTVSQIFGQNRSFFISVASTKIKVNIKLTSAISMRYMPAPYEQLKAKKIPTKKGNETRRN